MGWFYTLCEQRPSVDEVFGHAALQCASLTCQLYGSHQRHRSIGRCGRLKHVQSAGKQLV